MLSRQVEAERFSELESGGATQSMSKQYNPDNAFGCLPYFLLLDICDKNI
jgi:hypothetical protein